MRAGPDKALARVVAAFGAARPHHAYVFTNRSATRVKVLVHDGFGLWLCARRLYRGRFTWADEVGAARKPRTRAELNALIIGLP